MSDEPPTRCATRSRRRSPRTRVILFMKGTPEAPACGFSARTVAILQSSGAPFAAVDILPDPRIRQELSALSNWPTIPQLFVDGELVGGCDIVTEMYESGELQQALGARAAPTPEPDRGRASAPRRSSTAASRSRTGCSPTRWPRRRGPLSRSTPTAPCGRSTRPQLPWREVRARAARRRGCRRRRSGGWRSAARR